MKSIDDYIKEINATSEPELQKFLEELRMKLGKSQSLANGIVNVFAPLGLQVLAFHPQQLQAMSEDIRALFCLCYMVGYRTAKEESEVETLDKLLRL